MRSPGKYPRVSPSNPEAFAICDRCGFVRNQGDLVFQLQWGGTQIYSTQTLVCADRCYDRPNEQLRTIILPPDPPSIINARVPDYAYEEAGPVQSTLSANVLAGATLLPIVSATGFEVGMVVWVQLNNATFAETEVMGVDLDTNVLSVFPPLLSAAPYTGVVSVELS